MFLLSLGGQAFFYWNIRISKLVKMTECDPLPSLLCLNLVSFAFVSPSFLGGKSSASCGRIAVQPAQVVSIWENKGQGHAGQSWRNKCKVLVPSSSADLSHQNSKASLVLI